MEIPLYLAMTAAEFHHCRPVPEYFAWMACHFSPYGTGLSNIPDDLPPESLVIVNDRTPILAHDPNMISDELTALAEKNQPAGFLLDFQRPECKQTEILVKHLVKTLPFPVCVSHLYAQDINCPVFLPPVPLNCPVEQHLIPWQGREIWLEAALGSLHLHVTEKGCLVKNPLPSAEENLPQYDPGLFCNYRIGCNADALDCFLVRSQICLKKLLAKAKQLGVTNAVGLWQELGT